MTLYKLDEEDVKKIKEIEEITLTDYEISEGIIPVANLISVIYDLKNELEVVEENFNDFKQEVEDNYRPLYTSELYD